MYATRLIMQPSEDLGGRGPWKDPKPDCLSNGPHRFGQGHFIPDGSLRVIQYCRRCGESKILETKIIEGKLQNISINKA